MASGVVKVWKADKGFGFLKVDGGGADVFLHIGELKKSAFVGEPEAGERLNFDIGAGDGRGPRASAISRA